MTGTNKQPIRLLFPTFNREAKMPSAVAETSSNNPKQPSNKNESTIIKIMTLPTSKG